MFADPETPVQTCLILSINKQRFSGFLICGDRYFIYGKIYPFFGIGTVLRLERDAWSMIRGRNQEEITMYFLFFLFKKKKNLSREISNGLGTNRGNSIFETSYRVPYMTTVGGRDDTVGEGTQHTAIRGVADSGG